NPITTNDYFEELKEIIMTYHIEPQHIYNMNEKGVMMGKGERTMVIVDHDQKNV
ncbi:hypothetical protein K435DRAFT_599323, partial [Dendrothele bispora CBS 962.96]